VRTREILFIFVVFSCTKSRIGLHGGELLSTIAKKLELTLTRARFGASDSLFLALAFDLLLRPVNCKSHHLYSVAHLDIPGNADSRS
jgi:hypothetical protein